MVRREKRLDYFYNYLFLSLAVNCNHILSVRGASLICEEYLLSNNKNISFLSIEILWNLLENGSQIMVGYMYIHIQYIDYLIYFMYMCMYICMYLFIYLFIHVYLFHVYVHVFVIL